jgi:hypothetical protein
MRRFDTTEYGRRFNRCLALGSMLSAASAFGLIYVHTLFSLLVMPLAYLLAYAACDVISQLGLGRPFNPPSKFDTPRESRDVRASDWMFQLIAIAITIGALFAMGNFADSVRGEDVWRW